MAQIRTTIELLTKVLRENGVSKIKPEFFRLSKFNQPDAVPPLWKLLFELLYYCDNGKIDNTSDRACGEFTDAEMVVYVKRELQNKGFFSKDFAVLPNDMSEGSREILLAFGWLMCKENIISRFIRNCTSPLDDDTGLYAEQDASYPRKLQNVSESPPGKQDIYNKVQQMLWLNNKLRLNLRSLYALQREKNVLKHRIHEATYGTAGSPDRNHLSQMEVYMLRHPEMLKNNIELVERDNERLQNLLKWRDHEDVFWRWMGSVLDAKLQERQTPGAGGEVVAGGDGVTTPTALKTRPAPAGRGGRGDGEALRQAEADVFAHLQHTQLTLQEAIIKYEAIVDHLETTWEEKSSEVSEEELDRVLSSIDMELSVQRASIALNNCQTYLKDQTPEPQRPLPPSRPSAPPHVREPQFVLEKGSRAAPSNRLRPPDPAPHLQDIEDEIRSLTGLVQSLQRGVDDKQNSFKQEMQTLGSKFQDAICIPPLGWKI